MHQGSEIPSVGLNTLLADALIEISEKNLGITLIKKQSNVEGIFTDGDLRRCLNQKIDINTTKIKDVMTKKFKTIEEDALAVDAARIMEKNKIFTLVVMKKNKNVGVISMHDLIQARILITCFLNKINILFFILIFCNYVYSQEVNEFKLNNIIVNSGSIEIEKKSNKIFLIMVFMLSLMILL